MKQAGKKQSLLSVWNFLLLKIPSAASLFSSHEPCRAQLPAHPLQPGPHCRQSSQIPFALVLYGTESFPHVGLFSDPFQDLSVSFLSTAHNTPEVQTMAAKDATTGMSAEILLHQLPGPCFLGCLFVMALSEELRSYLSMFAGVLS